MASYCLVICVLIFLQSNLAMSADTPTNGDIVADKFSKYLAEFNNNMYKGTTRLVDPISKFTVNTAPNILQLYALLNGVSVSPKVAALAKELYAKAVVGGNSVLGGAAVLGSSLLGNTMDTAAHLLQANNDVVEAAGLAGINLAGRAADRLAEATVNTGNIVNGGLTAAGSGLQAITLNSDVFFQGVSKLLNAIRDRLVLTVASTRNMMSALLKAGGEVTQGGAVVFSSNAISRTYQALSSFLQVLADVQKRVDTLVSSFAVPTTAQS